MFTDGIETILTWSIMMLILETKQKMDIFQTNLQSERKMHLKLMIQFKWVKDITETNQNEPISSMCWASIAKRFTVWLLQFV